MTCAQSMARRRQTRQDPRYKSQKAGDAQSRYASMRRKVEGEQLRRSRAKTKK